APVQAGADIVTATSVKVPGVSLSIGLTVVPPPETPTILTPPVVTTGRRLLPLTAPSASGVTYLWDITGGTLTSDPAANPATYTAGAVGTATIHCTARNQADDASPSATATVSIRATGVEAIAGEPTVSGFNDSPNPHFSQPMGVAVDGDGNI